jgi:DNA-binding PadR family transcriptional regulator
MGLVASRQAEHGNGRIPALTEKGDTLLTQLLPLWRKAQAEMKTELSREGFDESLRILKRLAAV